MTLTKNTSYYVFFVCLLILTPGVSWAECSPDQIVKMLDVNLEIDKIQKICDLNNATCTAEQIVKLNESNIEFDTIRQLCGFKDSSCTADQIGKMKDVGVSEKKIKQICWESDSKIEIQAKPKSQAEAVPVPVVAPKTKTTVKKKAVVASDIKTESSPKSTSEKLIHSPEPIKKQQNTPYGNIGAVRIKETNGVGFGSSFSSAFGILHIFYDKNLNSRSQIHVQVGRTISANYESGYLFDYEVDASRDYGLLTYRLFFSENSGFYFGLGAGISYNRIEYRDNLLNSKYKASGRGLLALAEIGWQGDTGYYFHVGFQPTLYVSYDDDYENSMVEQQVRGTDAEGLWEDSKQASQVSIGFGWFF